ncbi:MAG TPA: hypothetical protein VHZ31_06985 [Solirubrobacteraceae bacterium]|jgi:hypothetical protein|nr:hypothetical protein [Solirubrobacteraceae bacterium]
MSNTTTRSTRTRRGLGIAAGVIALATPLAMAPGASAYNGVGGLVGQVVAGSAGPECNASEGGGPGQGLELGNTLTTVVSAILPKNCNGPAPSYTDGDTLDKPTPAAAKATTTKKAKKAKKSKKSKKSKAKARAHR